MSQIFNIQSLINGDMNQLNLFTNTNGERSLYVEWVPDELTTEYATNYFSVLGEVTAIDFVKQKTGKARMMFVHFKHFNYDNLPDAIGISRAHPSAHAMPIMFGNARNPKCYWLKCRINTKPIQRVEYNPAQLTDMVDRLRKEIEELKQEVAALKVKSVEDVIETCNSSS